MRSLNSLLAGVNQKRSGNLPRGRVAETCGMKPHIDITANYGEDANSHNEVHYRSIQHDSYASTERGTSSSREPISPRCDCEPTNDAPPDCSCK